MIASGAYVTGDYAILLKPRSGLGRETTVSSRLRNCRVTLMEMSYGCLTDSKDKQFYKIE